MMADSNLSIYKSHDPATITANQLKNTPPIVLDEVLQGRVAGVEINKSKAKEAAKINIRGLGSIAKNQQPLYLINDKMYDSLPASINQKNIKKIDIVKAADATAMYGAKAANGIVRITTNDNLITGKITNQNGEAVANASVNINNTNKSVATNANGNFNFTTTDSIVDITVNAIGYNSINTSVYNIKLNKITIKENQASLSEVVVIGYGTSKKIDMTANIEKQNQYASDSLTPVGGWQYYTQYINKKIGIIGDTTDANQAVIRDKFGYKLNDIAIEFSVNKQGSAYNVKVITEIERTKAKTIAAIIQTGPKWINSKKKNKVKLPLKN
jgi:TonB-dependent SusC/RagA subfamily outer membrane receptor